MNTVLVKMGTGVMKAELKGWIGMGMPIAVAQDGKVCMAKEGDYVLGIALESIYPTGCLFVISAFSFLMVAN